MKDSFGATFIFIIVIAFIVLFTGYICVSINQTKAFNVKNEIVEALERYGNYSSALFKNSVKSAFEKEGYRTVGNCDVPKGKKVLGCGRTGECSITNLENVAFCITINPFQKTSESTSGIKGAYYTVETFYQLDLPIINSFFNLSTKGETQLILGNCDCE